MSRTKQSIKNSMFGILSYFIITLLSFFSRRIFADVLGSEYLGLNSLFTNLVSMLALADSGLWMATIFFLFDPLAKGDNKRVKMLLNYSKKLYRIISCIILLFGFIIIIFIDRLANGSIPINEVRFYFSLYVLSSALSYLLYYKKALLYADQKNYYVTIIYTICKLISITLQIVILLEYHSYLIFILLYLSAIVAENIICAAIVNRQYPYIKEKDVHTIDDITKKDIIIRMKALFVNNISGFIVNSTENLIISSFLGLKTVGIYSGYILLISTLRAIYSQFFGAFTTSFGNLATTEAQDRMHAIFKISQFFAFVFATVTLTCFLCVVQPFIAFWLGKDYLLTVSTVGLIAINTYVTFMQIPAVSVQNATGLHMKDQYIMIAQAVINLIMAVSFVDIWGLNGVIVAVLLSNIFFPSLSKPYVVYKHVLKKPIREYFKSCAGYTIVFMISIISGLILIRQNTNLGVYSIVINLVIALMISIFLIIIFFRNTNEFKKLFKIAKPYLEKYLFLRLGR